MLVSATPVLRPRPANFATKVPWGTPHAGSPSEARLGQRSRAVRQIEGRVQFVHPSRLASGTASGGVARDVFDLRAPLLQVGRCFNPDRLFLARGEKCRRCVGQPLSRSGQTDFGQFLKYY